LNCFSSYNQNNNNSMQESDGVSDDTEILIISSIATDSKANLQLSPYKEENVR